MNIKEYSRADPVNTFRGKTALKAVLATVILVWGQ
jgi:hypothetical protein